MTTFVLIPGAGSGPGYWQPLEEEIAKRGHRTIAVDLPCDDDAAGLAEYADAVVAAIGDRRGIVLAAHSFGGFTGPLVADRIPVDLLVMLSAMVPAPGERPAAWWANTGHGRAFREHAERLGIDPADEAAVYYNGCSPAQVAVAEAAERGQSGTPMDAPWPLAVWPNVPTRFLLCRDDRFFPAPFMRRVVRDRLGIVPDEMPGGHMAMLSHPTEMADRLAAYAAETVRQPVAAR